jgi:hypothetical protein
VIHVAVVEDANLEPGTPARFAVVEIFHAIVETVPFVE